MLKMCINNFGKIFYNLFNLENKKNILKFKKKKFLLFFFFLTVSNKFSKI